MTRAKTCCATQPMVGSHSGAGETSALLPAEEYRLAGRRKNRRSRLWLIPAFVFFLLIAFLQHLPFVWFGSGWVQEARKLDLDLGNTNIIKFQQEGRTVYGTLDIVEIEENSPQRIEVEVFTFTYDVNGVNSLDLMSSDDGVVLNYDRKSILPMKVRATLHVQPGKGKEIFISTTSLDININTPTIDFSAISIESTDGSVNSVKPAKSDEMTIRLKRGAISGVFYLLEKLRLSTAKGNIDIRIEGEDALGTAITDVRSESGDVHLTFGSLMPGRIYETTVELVSGRLTGSLPLGEMLVVKSTSGDVDFEVKGSASATSLFGTENISGNTRVKFDTESLNGLLSHHATVTGDVDVQYPSFWEGEIHLKSHTGNIELLGNGIELTERSDDSSRNEIWAKRGRVSNSRIMGQSTSGDLTISVGS